MSSVWGWAAYVPAHHVRRHGLAATWHFHRQARSVATRNRPLRQAQRKGWLWRHTAAEFIAAIEAAGFDVLQVHEVYRGHSDLVIARKPASGAGAGLGLRRHRQAAVTADAIHGCRQRLATAARAIGQREP